jgi:hypothetical protein
MTRELIKARYSRIRASLVADNGIIDHIPPLKEVPEAEWDKDEAYLAEQRKGQSFTYSRINGKAAVMLGTLTYWQEVLEAAKDGEVEEVRSATENEIVEFVMGGGIEDADQADQEFQRGWDEYSERC